MIDGRRWTVNDWLSEASQRLKKAGVPSARLDVELLLAHVLQKDRIWLIAHGKEKLDDESSPKDTISYANELLERRLEREPIAYLIGKKEFYGRDFIVTSDVLIPRPESEALIELAKIHQLKGKLLDVGTGSGCLGITLALETDMELTASDISEDALEIAMENANQQAVRGAFAVSYLLDRWRKHRFDLIAANLPYVDRSWTVSPETAFEPDTALFAESKGLALINKLVAEAPALLMPQGHLLLEADLSQHAAITKTAERHGFSHVADQGYALLFKRTV